jgi:O-6-methylguanine DNA methyltransferase
MDPRATVWMAIAGPRGPVHVAATARGVVAVEQLTTDDAFIASLRRRLGGPIEDASDVPTTDSRRRSLSAGVAALEALLSGHPPADAPALDLADRPDWDRRVLSAVAGIPWGRTASYGDIARAVGSPRAARAVGGAVGRNPISLLVPCHRVIAADGTIGGYGSDGWGSREERLALKRALLLREGVTVPTADR